MTTHCICCSASPLIPTHSHLLECPKCGHISADLKLTDEELIQLYSKNYFHGEEYGDYRADKSVLQRNFSARLKAIHHLIGDTSDLSLFEVGCAYGFFLEVARPYFRHVKGIDICSEVIAKACSELGVDAYAGDFLSPEWQESPSDVVCMWDTIEHLRNPHDFIHQAAKILPSGGHLFLTTGDISSFNAKIRRGKWRLIHPPTHLHYFTRDSIRELLEKNGFELLEIKAVGFYRSIGNTIANLFRKQLNTNIINQLAKIHSYFYLNLYDIMLVSARRL
ncbi:MAG: class I SAM-dependent methyltransferase [Chthoniobacterales bacterium]